MTPTRSNRPRVAALTIGVAALLSAACAKSETASTSASITTAPASATTAPGASAPSRVGVAIGNPWVRETPGGMNRTAAYADLTSATGDRLLSAAVPESVAGKVELHETVMAGPQTDDTDTDAGMGAGGDAPGTTAMHGSAPTMAPGMTMRPVEHIDLPAGTTVSLKPGGLHIMMLDLVEPLEAGATVEVTLTFEKAGPQKVTMPVKEG